MKPHRGGMVLAFGILSWFVCSIFAPLAWVQGNTDLAEMDSGVMDPEGRAMTQAGKIIGMVHCIFFFCGLFLFVVLMCLGIVAG